MVDTSAHAESSTSSSSLPRRTFYDVFLSFRGEDTRKNFTDHLYSALNRRGFRTFRDDDKLDRGEEITLGLLEAIEKSKVSVIVFSRNYAASRWCLDELVKILECKKKFKQIVMPVFYDVDPSDVRTQRGSFAEAFAKHEERYKGRGMEGKVERWRAALTEAANLSGRHLQNEANGHESKFIDTIVEDIFNKLNLPYLNVANYPIGIESRVHHVNELLSLGSDNVRMVGIWGIGGLGKTTIAKAIYNQIHHQFESSSFLADVREVSKQPNGLVRLQEHLLSECLMNENQKIRNVDRGIEVIKQRLWSKRVLVILDDVDDFEQLKALAIRRDLFHSGSRIIVTTRDEFLLKFLDVDEVYTPDLLTYNESLELFRWHAFKPYHPIEDYVDFSRKLVYYAGGLPLVLEVLGSFFASTSVPNWKRALKRLKEIPNDKIQEKLRISFDSLNDFEKDLFLDIACFFVGMDKNYAMEILEVCGIGLENLSRRCLIKIDGHWLEMHDIIRDMGREIVRKEHCKEPGKRSRLWFHKDVLNVLKNNTGTKQVEGLDLNLPTSENVKVNAQAFTKMYNIRLLKLDFVHLSGSYEHLSKRLKWLCWNGFPEKSLPSELFLEEVVAIDMCYSNLTQVWKGTKNLYMLKFLILSHSYNLTETPDFSEVPSLEMLFLNDCKKLVKVHQSIECLNNLAVLDLNNCKNLRYLPLGIFKSKSLQNLILSGCSRLEKVLGFKESSSKSWFSRFFSLLRDPNPTSLAPSSIEGLIPMRRLILEDCNLSYVPEELGSLTSLEVLDLERNKFCTLPASISQLSQLWGLCLSRCTELRSLPELPVNLKWVNATHCTSLERISIGSEFRKSPSLFFYGCHKLVELDFASYGRKSLLRSQEQPSVGEFSILFPGAEVPDYFDYQGVEDHLPFAVCLLPNRKIRGWILCTVLESGVELVASGLADPAGPAGPHLAYPFSYEVKNKTQGFERCYEIAFDDRLTMHSDHTWLHYAPQHCLQLEMQAGDEVEYSLIGVPSGMRVKKCGVKVIYEDDEKEYPLDDQAMVHYATPSCRDVIVDKNVSANQSVAGGHSYWYSFVCLVSFSMLLCLFVLFYEI